MREKLNGGENSLSGGEEIPNKKEEHYSVPKELVIFVDKLFTKEDDATSKRVLKSLKFDLNYANSLEHARNLLQNAGQLGDISNDDLERMESFLEEGTDETQSEPEALNWGNESDGGVEEAHNEKSTEEALKKEEEIIPVANVEERQSEVELSAEELERNLDNARSEYATRLTEWKNKTRAKKNIFSKVLSDLGVERHLPNSEKPQELKDAEVAYIEAKKQKNKALFSQSEGWQRKDRKGQIIERYQFNPSLVDQTEKEYEQLQKQLLETIPPLEKGIVTKMFEGWAKLPRYQRIALSTTLMTGTSFLFGGAAASGVAAYAGYRAIRSLSGAAVAQGAGRLVDKVANQTNKNFKANVSYEYGKSISEENFEEKERELMQRLEEHEKHLKQGRAVKAAIMVGAGGVTSAGANLLQTITNFDPLHLGGGGGSAVSEHIPKTRIDETLAENHAKADVTAPKEVLSESETILHPKGEEALTTEIPKESVSEVVPEAVAEKVLPEVKVELSSRGFIADLENMKMKLIEQYGGADKVPAQYEHLMDTTSTKLAEEFGFYDPEKGLSGMGLKGESLHLDKNGDLVYEKLGGAKETIFDAESGEVKKFAGKMFSPDQEGVTPESEVTEEVSPDTAHHEHITENENVGASSEEVATETGNDGANVEENTTQQSEVVPEKVSKARESTVATHDTQETPLVRDKYVGYEYEHRFTSFNGHDGRSKDLETIVTGINPQVLIFENQEIAHGRELAPNDQKILELDDKFQDGEKYKEIREAYVAAVSDNADLGVLVHTNIPMPFEGGKISIIQGINENPNVVVVLLNGKEIARGTVEVGGIKVEMPSNLKSSWLFADTVYERAFKQASNIIKTLSYKK